MNEENEEFEREMNYKSPSQVEGDLVAREFADGQEDEDGLTTIKYKYITVLDFEVGRVFQYKIEVSREFDGEFCELYVINKGHNLSNCEWMVHDSNEIITN